MMRRAALLVLLYGLLYPTTTTLPSVRPLSIAARDENPPRLLPAAVPARATRSAHRTPLPAVLLRIRWCESRDSYQAENPHSTASGAYQFLGGTWASLTGLRPPASAYSRTQQDRAALDMYRRAGTRPWRASRNCWH